MGRGKVYKHNPIKPSMMADASEPIDGLPESIDIETLDELSEEFRTLPLRAQQIAALLAIGYKGAAIETAFNLPAGTVKVYKSQYLTSRKISVKPDTRNKIIAAVLRSHGLQLVSGITPDKIEQAGVGELSKSASLLLDRADKLEGQQTAIDQARQISDALSRLTQSPAVKQVKEKAVE